MISRSGLVSWYLDSQPGDDDVETGGRGAVGRRGGLVVESVDLWNDGVGCVG